MRTQKVEFPGKQVLCVFPASRTELDQAISEMHLNEGYPVIVLIGGEIGEHKEEATRKAVQTISGIADELKALVICGGTDMGVMAEIGQIRWTSGHTYPLVGITLEELATWPGGPLGTKFLWWGKERWQLEPHYSNFILVPGSQFGDESPWIVDAATILSHGHRSVTILINGGEVSRKDIELSLGIGRPVIVLSRTGRLADELATDPDRHKLITVIPANSEQRLMDAMHSAISPEVIEITA
jgi:hypothetical protein